MTAFGALYREYAPLLFRRVLMPRLGRRDAAEDALAETFKTALEKLHQFQPKKVSVYFWLSRIAMNKATDMHRVRARTGRALSSFEDLLGPLREQIPQPGLAAEKAEEAKAIHAAIAATMEALNPRYRWAIELRFLEGKSRDACAEIMEVKVGTFDVLILRALRAFRREWTKFGGVES